MEQFTSAIMWAVFIVISLKLLSIAINFQEVKAKNKESEANAVKNGEYKPSVSIGLILYVASIIYLFC
jgi:hypothetical protein